MDRALWLTILALLMSISTAEPLGFTAMDPTYTVRITQGNYLEEDSAAYAKMHPKPEDPTAAHLNLSFVAGSIILETEEGEYTYYGYMYKDNKDGSVNTFGPTLRFTPPAYPTLDLYNELTLPVTPDPNNVVNEWRDTTFTNMHMHGFWAYHGVSDIKDPEPYTGGDNVFFELGPKKSVDDPPPHNLYNYTIGPYHLPGNHWYHPHKHQATALQTQTASGNTIIDGEGTFLTSERGCDQILEMLLAAQERIIQIQVLFFQPSTPSGFNALESMYQDPGYQEIAENSGAGDPVCCNETRTGYAYNMTTENFPLVNGNYQPIITMQAGVYQRWRMLNAGFKHWQDFVIVNEDDDELAPCDLQLIAKDGIYIMDLPRSINHVTLAAANRADILIKCNGTVGKRYRLASGVYPSFGPAYVLDNDGDISIFPNIATIEITDPAGASPLLMTDLRVPDAQKACSPLRPSYVADLRDPIIQERGIHTLRQQLNAQNEVLKGGCTLNGRNWTFPTDINNPPMVMQMGEVVENQYLNQQFHPVHLHESPQQIVALDARALASPGNVTYSSYFEVGDWYDTIRIPNIADPNFSLNDSSITTRLQPGPFSGYSVIHCHYLEHEDRGCMKVVQWRCPSTNPGVNGSIDYPCSGGFDFPVGGDFVQENTLYNNIPAFYPPPPNPFTTPAPAPAIATTTPAPAPAITTGTPVNVSSAVVANTTGRRRLSQTGSPVTAPLAAPIPLQQNTQELNYSLPYCNCTNTDIYNGQQYCFRLDGSSNTVDTQCHYCTASSFSDEPCQRSGALDPAHPSLYVFCRELVQLPSGLQMPGYDGAVNGIGLNCTNVNFNPHPPPPVSPILPGAPTCTCKDAGPGWGFTGSVICYALVNESIPDTNCVPPPENAACSVQLPIESIGNMTDGYGKLCSSSASAPATALAPTAGV